MVGTDFPEGVHHVCVAVQTKDLFLGPSDGEFASAVNVLVVRQIESAEASLGEVSQEDVPSLAKVGLPQFCCILVGPWRRVLDTIESDQPQSYC